MTDIGGHGNVMADNTLLDATGLLCPLPVLKLRKRLRSLRPGAVITMIATDPAAVIDVPHFCNETGHVLVEQTQDGERFRFSIRKV
jgi:tRNA 2-thiouridine synthesizing protein A